MSTSLASVSNNVVQQQMTPEQVDLLKRTICKDATDDELRLFMHVCQRTGLDPFARQVYAVKRFDKKSGRDVMVVQTSIDGFRLAAARSNSYAGSDDPIFDNEDSPKRSTVTVYKIVQGLRCPFTATARWKEYYPGEKLGYMWDKMPCVMLGKVAEALALRKAFPADLSGVYAKEEMDQAESDFNPHAAKNMQPEPGEGHVLDKGYRINFGKWNRRSLEEVLNNEGPEAIRGYIEYIESSAAKQGKPIDPNGPAGVFIREAESFLGAFENQETPIDMPRGEGGND